jgi:ribonucleoside-diphosphate reductase alpha chain
MSESGLSTSTKNENETENAIIPMPKPSGNIKFKDDFSREVWHNTYKDYNDDSIDDTVARVATAIASVETTPEAQALWVKNFTEMLTDFKVTPGGRILSNAGTEWNGTTLINCYVGPRKTKDLDSLDGILGNLTNQSKTLKSEGGWGENFSYIRPRGSFIEGIGVESPGSVKFMEMFDKTSEVVTSGSGTISKNKKSKNKIRKGAMMGVMDVWHPDVIEFITAKQSAGRLSKFNMSVNCTDEFMSVIVAIESIKKDIRKYEAMDVTDNEVMMNLKIARTTLELMDTWDLVFPDTMHKQYRPTWGGNLKEWLAKGYPVVTYRTIKASYLWDLIMKSTYNRAEPGVLYLDRANHFNPLVYGETIMATNPCGEQTLAPGGVCCLASLNLTQFFNEKTRKFDFKTMKKYASYAVRFLDNVNEFSNAPLPEYKDNMLKKRRIGVGLLGWGSLLYMMKIPFDSAEAAALREEVGEAYSKAVYEASIDLAIEKGMFEKCVPEKHAESPFIKNLGLSEEYMNKLRTTGIRNSACLSIQPTGNTSILANIASGGIEPVFMPEYVRTVIVGEMPVHLEDKCPKWYEGEWYETEYFKLAKEGDEEILAATIDGVKYKIDRNRGLTKEVVCQDYGTRWLAERGEWDATAPWASTTMNLPANAHVEDLKGWAKYVDSAISKTINLPFEYSYDEFQDLYLDAYKTGYIKGLTTYRAGTMTAVLSTKEDNKGEEEIILDDVKLPDDAAAKIKIIRAEQKKWYVTVTFMDNDHKKPFALFVKTNTREPTIQSSDAVERLIDMARRKGIPESHIEATESKMGNDSNADKVARAISLLLRHGVLIKNVVHELENVSDVFVGSFLFQIRKYLATFIKDGEKVEDEGCQECGNGLVFQEGCIKCSSCGWTKC